MVRLPTVGLTVLRDMAGVLRNGLFTSWVMPSVLKRAVRSLATFWKWFPAKPQRAAHAHCMFASEYCLLLTDVFCPLYNQIEVNLPEDSCQRDRKFIWVAGSGQTDTESIDLLCLGDKEFEVDITLWCKQSVQKFVTKNSTFGAALGITRASTKDEWIQAFWT